jgi:hypothetical protein
MTLTDREKIALIEKLYAATGVGDFDAAEEYLTDDFFITEAQTLPFSGIYKGKTALRELYTKVMGMMDVASLDVVQHTVGGDYGVTILSLSFQDSSLAPAPLLELFHFRGDQICEIKPYYFDPTPVLAACKAKGSI